MKRSFLPLLLGLLMLCSGCVATGGSTQAASQEWRLQSLEESFLDFQEAQRLEAERSRKADEELAQRIDRLEQRLTALLGGEELPPEQKPVESMEQGGGQEMGSGKTPAGSASYLEMDGQRVPPQASRPADPRMAEPMPAPMPAPIKAGPESSEEKPWSNVPGPALEAKVRQPVASASSPSPSGGGSAQSLYDKGLNLVQSGRAEQARSVLEQFLREYPSHKLAPNAMYWTGESWYGQKNYPQAILAFKDVVAKFPKHSKAQAALLKIGMSYRNVGDKDNAVFYLRTLVDDHPGSEPARMAEQLLREIPN